jgi:Fe-S oxidoreductase
MLAMFNRNTCTACGTCLVECPFLDITRKGATEEVARLVQGRGAKEIIRSCTVCGYCDMICPTGSNPSHLREEILFARNRDKGVSCLWLMSEEVPANLMTVGLEFEREEKLKRLALYSETYSSKEVFHLGCSLSYIYTDLAETTLLDDLPKIGGLKFCCGAFVRILFGEEEAAVKGRRLLQELKDIGVERMVTICPECDQMLGDFYPRILPEFDIERMSVVQYLLERHRNGRLRFSHPLHRKVAFHDPCAWRKMAPAIHDRPRELLEAMGAEVVEMAHNRRESMCCGLPMSGRDPKLAAEVAGERVLEAAEAGAEVMAVSCTGCFAMSEKAAEHGLDLYHITELAQVAIGETPRHRIEETKTRLAENLMQCMGKDPEMLNQRYVLRNGEVVPL